MEGQAGISHQPGDCGANGWEDMGGERDWNGSSFYFDFAADVADISADLQDLDGGSPTLVEMENKRALIIDDNGSALEMLIRATRSLGMITNGASSLQEGKTHLEREEYDVVLMDAMMTDEDGQDLAEKIKSKRYGEVWLVLLSPWVGALVPRLWPIAG